MTAEILLRYLHFISIFVVVGALTAEHLLIKEQMKRREIQRLSILDAVYGLGAVLLVTAGLFLWFGVGKPAVFYTQNWVFHLKISLVIILALSSIPPTIFFLKNRKGESQEEMVNIPKFIRILIRIELLLLLLIPLSAVFMAKGIGFMGQ